MWSNCRKGRIFSTVLGILIESNSLEYFAMNWSKSSQISKAIFLRCSTLTNWKWSNWEGRLRREERGFKWTIQYEIFSGTINSCGFVAYCLCLKSVQTIIALSVPIESRIRLVLFLARSIKSQWMLPFQIASWCGELSREYEETIPAFHSTCTELSVAITLWYVCWFSFCVPQRKSSHSSINSDL